MTYTPDTTRPATIDRDQVTGALDRITRAAHDDLARTRETISRSRTLLHQALSAPGDAIVPAAVASQFTRAATAAADRLLDGAERLVTGWTDTVAVISHATTAGNTGRAAEAVDDLLLHTAASHAEQLRRDLSGHITAAVEASAAGSGPAGGILRARADRILRTADQLTAAVTSTAATVDATALDCGVGLRLLDGPPAPAGRPDRLDAACRRGGHDTVQLLRPIGLFTDVADQLDQIARTTTSPTGEIGRRVIRTALLVLRGGAELLATPHQATGDQLHTLLQMLCAEELTRLLDRLPDVAVGTRKAVADLHDALLNIPAADPGADEPADPADTADPTPAPAAGQPHTAAPATVAAVQAVADDATDVIRQVASDVTTRLVEATGTTMALRGEQLRADLDRHAADVTETATRQITDLATRAAAQITNAAARAVAAAQPYNPAGVDLADTGPAAADLTPVTAGLDTLTSDIGTVSRRIGDVSDDLDVLHEVAIASDSALKGFNTRIQDLEFQMAGVLVAVNDLADLIRAGGIGPDR